MLYAVCRMPPADPTRPSASSGEELEPGPLATVRVIELGTIVAASFAARLLADMGAEVIKAEAPDRPDPMRQWGRGEYKGRTLWWPIQNRNKKLITLNLRVPAGAELLTRLCREADVLIENFRPGTLERWGLDYDRLSAANPGLILARVSGFGQTGPLASRPGYAAVGEAMGGLRYVNGYPDQPPPRCGLSLGDSLAAMFASQGVLAALHERSHSGWGQVVDTSLADSCMALLESAIAEYDTLGIVREPSGTRLPGVSPSNLFRSRDGHWLVIAANQDRLFRSLCEAIGRPDLAEDARFSTHAGRAENQDELERIIECWVAARDAEDVDRALNEAGVVVSPVSTVADIVANEQFKARDMLVTHHDEELGDFLAQGVVPKLSRTPGSVRWSGPWGLGAHNDDVYRGLLRLDDAQVDALRDAGAI
jgi:formyl-CoA transferase